MKKMRGFKRKWHLMLNNLEEMANNISDSDNEIFIVESFDYYNKKIAGKYKIDLLKKLLEILNHKQTQDKGRCYLLWYFPTEIFESNILIFNNLNELSTFFQDNKSSDIEDDYVLNLDSKNTNANSQLIPDYVKPEEYLTVIASTSNPSYLDQIDAVLIADQPIIETIKRELTVSDL